MLLVASRLFKHLAQHFCNISALLRHEPESAWIVYVSGVAALESHRTGSKEILPLFWSGVLMQNVSCESWHFWWLILTVSSVVGTEQGSHRSLHSHTLCHHPPAVKHFSLFHLLIPPVSTLIQTLLNTAKSPKEKKMDVAAARNREKKMRGGKGRIHFAFENQHLLALRLSIQKQKTQALYFQGYDILKAGRQINSWSFMFAFSETDKAQIGVQNTSTVRHCSFPRKMQAPFTNTTLLATEAGPHGRSLLPSLINKEILCWALWERKRSTGACLKPCWRLRDRCCISCPSRTCRLLCRIRIKWHHSHTHQWPSSLWLWLAIAGLFTLRHPLWSRSTYCRWKRKRGSAHITHLSTLLAICC